MSAKGCSPDNAAAEGFFGRLKNELFYGRDWRGVGYEEFRDPDSTCKCNGWFRVGLF